MKGLRALVYADATGKKGDAFFIRQALPLEVQGVLSWMEYLGRHGDLRARKEARASA